jgi:hypothetical protein
LVSLRDAPQGTNALARGTLQRPWVRVHPAERALVHEFMLRSMRPGLAPLLFVGALTTALAGCPRSDTQQGQNPGQFGAYPPGQFTPNGQQPNGQYGQPPNGQYGQPPNNNAQYPQQPQSTPAGPPSPNDPINVIDLAYLRSEAGSVLGETIAALPPQKQQMVSNIPFVADPSPGEVNAFAACDDAGQPLMAITDGLLEIEAYISAFKATDELYGTAKLRDYMQMIAQQSKPQRPLPRPPPGFIDPVQNADGRKVARQHVLLDEQLAFVLGHELGHHYLGHTGCANGGSSRASAADLGRILSRSLPLFNQPNEIAADVAGTNSTLTTGAKRQGAKWNEEGALLTLDFFATLDSLSPAAILFGFQNSHPHPLVRRPIVQQAANSWRATGGQGWQIPTLPQLFGQ